MTTGPAQPAGSGDPLGPEVAELVATAASAVRGVAELNGGAFGEVATYLPGRRVKGVRETPDQLEVHLTLDWGVDVPSVADRVRRAVQKVPGVGGRKVEIFVEDISEKERA